MCGHVQTRRLRHFLHRSILIYNVPPRTSIADRRLHCFSIPGAVSIASYDAVLDFVVFVFLADRISSGRT